MLPVILLALYVCTKSFAHPAQTCRCMPGDACWPDSQAWSAFNASVDGKLVATTPLAASCHEPNYDSTACLALRSNWTQPALHDESSSSIMAAAVSNETCDPFTSSQSPCTLGNMVLYSVNASTPSDIQKTLFFAREKNIRFVIRNTGHDYLGRSTGAGALSIWTHHMKGVTQLNYTSQHYTGPAVKLGAGIQVAEAYEAIDKFNAVIVGGDCATVGVAGGYTQGGGHSILSSKFGLGADQALEWEVIDGTGQIMTVSRTQNPDLYWALSGGGGGTFGVVVSLTVKLHPGVPVTGVTLQFKTPPDDPSRFYEAVSAYYLNLKSFTDVGGTAIAAISNETFSLTPLAFPDVKEEQVNKLIQPFLTQLAKIGVTYEKNVTEYPSFLDMYNALIRFNPTQLVQNGQYGGWLVPNSILESKQQDLTAAIRTITQDGVSFVGIGLDVSSRVVPDPYNSVNPSWRDTAIVVILTTPWPEGADLGAMKGSAEKMTNKWVKALSDLAPESGAYLSEADPNQPNWKAAFYGSNYDRLYSIKTLHDPSHLFYAPTAVGSDDWQPEPDGRLCWRGK